LLPQTNGEKQNKKKLLNLNTNLTNLTNNMSPTDMKEMAEMSLMDKNIKTGKTVVQP
jgi:hypothetical protein